jgi:hypothetical protein
MGDSVRTLAVKRPINIDGPSRIMQGVCCDRWRVLTAVWELRTRLCGLHCGYTDDQGASCTWSSRLECRARRNLRFAVYEAVAKLTGKEIPQRKAGATLRLSTARGSQ